jgi:hypothetical protein
MGDACQAIQLSLLKHDASECRGCDLEHAGRRSSDMADNATCAATLAEVEEERGRMVEI